MGIQCIVAMKTVAQHAGLPHRLICMLALAGRPFLPTGFPRGGGRAAVGSSMRLVSFQALCE